MKLFAVTLFCIQLVTGARILALFPHVGKSHHDVYSPYLKKLATRGHEVVVVSHFPQESPLPNIIDISIKGSVPVPPTEAITFGLVEYAGSIVNVIMLSFLADIHCKAVLQLPQVQQLSSQQFDLIITEVFNTDCHLGLVHILKSPFIFFSSSVLLPWANDRIGNPDNPSYIPNVFKSYSDKMSFVERLLNTFDTVVDNWILYPLLFDMFGRFTAQTHLGVSLPPLSDIASRGSLILVNTHFSLSRPRPLVPGVIEVGGIHIDKLPKKLPQDIEDYINGAEHGIIYFSMGSMIQADSLPDDKRDAFIQAFSELPQRVLWKWGVDTLPGQPKNVKIAKWLPQFDILNHPKVRVFMAHGGLLGTIEAVHVGVPMIGIPMYGDQNTNVKMVEAAGMAVILQYWDITKDNVLKALRTVLDNSSYTENAKRTSRLFRDRPMSPMDTAIYWTEYVIRHQGAPHMRTAGADLPLYQYLLLDVVSTLLTAFLVVAYVIYIILKKIIHHIRGIIMKLIRRIRGSAQRKSRARKQK